MRQLRSVDIVTSYGTGPAIAHVFVSVAEQRDVIRMRTNYRHNSPEDVYIYRASGAPGAGRRFFLQYMEQLNALRKQPEFYNTLTTNGTTNIWMNARVNSGRVPMSWKILAGGYVPEYLYEQGKLDDMRLSFPESQHRAHANARAKAADSAADFSRRIRAWSETRSSGGVSSASQQRD